MGAAPLWLALALIGDVLVRRKFAVTRTLAFFALYLACELSGLAIAGWLWLRHAGWRSGNNPIFVARNFQLQSLMDDMPDDAGVVIYPEGTRFSAAKRQRILDKLEHGPDAKRLAQVQALTHVLPPRVGGALALLRQNERADALFCAHHGLEGGGSFAELINGGLIGRTVRIKLWRVPYAAIPTTRGERIDWLLGQWQQVDTFVGKCVAQDVR